MVLKITPNVQGLSSVGNKLVNIIIYVQIKIKLFLKSQISSLYWLLQFTFYLLMLLMIEIIQSVVIENV